MILEGVSVLPGRVIAAETAGKESKENIRLVNMADPGPFRRTRRLSNPRVPVPAKGTITLLIVAALFCKAEEERLITCCL
jgi:hypothetical protein